MNEERVRQIIRHFPENGMKQVLTSAGNVRDLLALAGAKVLPRLDFAGMEIDPTTYVTAEYRHVSSDLVLRVTMRPSGKGRRRKRLTVTILIELQAQPDRLMLVRVLEYLVQIWKHPIKQYGQKHGSLASVKLQPILPVVLHTGSYAWQAIGSLLDLMDDAEDFREVTPAFKPLFVSLPNVTDKELVSKGGYFGQVLALFKTRNAGRGSFAQRLDQTVTKLKELTGEERLRRLELLSYVEGLVYHSREGNEHQMLRERIDSALSDDETRLEMDMVRRTLADIHREEAALEANKRVLIDQLRLRFKSLPPDTEQTIVATQDHNQILEWLRGVITARDFASIGIRPSH